jgi:hypothetical protein
MRGAAGALVAGALALALPAAAEAQLSLRAQADAIMNKDFREFVAYKRSRPKPFNWSDDGCSPGWIPKRLYRNLFNEPCQQHDFGYRNYGNSLFLGRNEDTRAWIDARFRTEMRRLCNENFTGRWRVGNRVACRTQAQAVYDTVRHHFGRRAFYREVNNPADFAGHIVQWDRDPKAHKTAWLVGADLKRRWIPTSGVYGCLKSQGHLGPTVLPAAMLDRLTDLNGVHAACAPPPVVMPLTPPPVGTPAPVITPPAPARRALTVDNRVTNGMGMREDATPARLTTRPWIRCSSRGCNIAGTERRTGGVYDAAICQTFGERTTNGHDSSSADDANPERFESTRYYGVRLGDGTFGYVSEVWIRASDRGGLGLPAC